jgi:phosphoglycerol transferase MdoB-like AlkP superfamily enzyme
MERLNVKSMFRLLGPWLFLFFVFLFFFFLVLVFVFKSGWLLPERPARKLVTVAIFLASQSPEVTPHSWAPSGRAWTGWENFS